MPESRPNSDGSPAVNAVRDPNRLAALRRTALLDALAVENFDRLTRMAAQLLDVPVTFISLVDEHRDFYLSHCGFGEPLASTRQITGETFCHFAIVSEAPLVIPDTRADPIYRQVPTVESLGVAAYLGVPLRISTGEALGSLCAIDTSPRDWGEREVQLLSDLAASVTAEIELRISKADLERRIEERTIELNRSESLFRALIEHGRDLFALLEADGAFRYTSPSFQELLGYAPAELLGLSAFDLIHPDDLPRVLEAFGEVVQETRLIRGVRYRFRHSDGSWRWLESIGNNALEDPAVQGIVVNSRDITERAKAETDLEAQRRLLRSVLDSSPNGVFLKDAHGRFTFANPFMAGFYGLTPEEVVGTTDAELGTPPEEVEYFRRNDRQVLETREMVFSPATPFTVPHSGEIRWFETRKVAVSISDQDQVLGTTTDVTDLKRTEVALRASKNSLQALIQASPLPIEALDPDGNVTLWNPAAERIFGWSRSEVVGRPSPLVAKHQQEEHRALRERVMSGESIAGVEIRRQRKDGSSVELRVSAAPLHDDTGSTTGIMAILEDVTEQKRAQAALQESERRLTTLIQNLPGVVYRSNNDPQWTMEYIGGRTQELIGYSPEEMLGEGAVSFADRIHPEDRERIYEAVQRAVTKGEPFELEYRIHTATGEEKWVWEQGQGVFSHEGELEALEGFIADMTERKRAEEHERQLTRERVKREEAEVVQQRIYDILESVTDAFFAVDDQWLFTYVNSEVEALSGKSREELLGQNLWELFPTSPESRFWTELHRAVEEQVTVEFEEYGPNTRIWARVRAYPREEGLTVYVRDTTAHRQAEAEADLEQRRLRAVMDALPVAVFVADASGKVVQVSAAARRIWETEHLPRPESPEEYHQYTGWCPHTGQRLEPHEWGMARALQGESIDEQEIRIETFSGARKTILNYARPIYDAGGQPVGAVSASVDITARKKTEDALHESRLTMQSILAASPDIVEMINPDGRFRWVSPAIRDVLGYEMDQVHGRPMQDLIAAEDREAFESSLGLLADDSIEEVRLRYSALHRDGHMVPFEARGRAVRNETLRSLVLVARDVTEQEQLTQQLQTSLREKEVLLQEIHHRVKNNLQIISSLLNMQMRILREPVALEALRESRERIQSMTLIHETLYSTGTFAELDLAVYLRRLAPQLQRSFGPASGVQLKLDLQRCPTPLDTAVPLGLVASELITNAFKHAFPGGAQGEVRVDLHADEKGAYLLVVGDNGVGLPEEERVADLSVGMQLVHGLVRQIGGDLEVRRGAGAEFRITFAVQDQGEG